MNVMAQQTSIRAKCAMEMEHHVAQVMLIALVHVMVVQDWIHVMCVVVMVPAAHQHFVLMAQSIAKENATALTKLTHVMFAMEMALVVWRDFVTTALLTAVVTATAQQ